MSVRPSKHPLVHKRLQALQEKRIALGHRPDDHVEQTMGGMTMR